MKQALLLVTTLLSLLSYNYAMDKPKPNKKIYIYNEKKLIEKVDSITSHPEVISTLKLQTQLCIFVAERINFSYLPPDDSTSLELPINKEIKTMYKRKKSVNEKQKWLITLISQLERLSNNKEHSASDVLENFDTLYLFLEDITAVHTFAEPLSRDRSQNQTMACEIEKHILKAYFKALSPALWVTKTYKNPPQTTFDIMGSHYMYVHEYQRLRCGLYNAVSMASSPFLKTKTLK